MSNGYRNNYLTTKISRNTFMNLLMTTLYKMDYYSRINDYTYLDVSYKLC